MILEETEIRGCYTVKMKIFKDSRGIFMKNFQESIFENHGLDSEFKEDFYSFSAKNVIRGMHFQTPPHDHAKYVTCITGRILDVVVDLRSESPTFGHHIGIELNSDNGLGVYIPKGCAHGFLSLEENSCVYYKVGTEHNLASDGGILWDSFGFDWPCNAPIISNRDTSFPKLSDYKSPFL